MPNPIDRGLALLSMALKQPITAFCDLDTVDGMAMVTHRGDLATVLRLRGMRMLLQTQEVIAGAAGLRQTMASFLTSDGHALQAFFVCDPERAGPVVRAQVGDNRAIARALRLGMDEILDERERLWSELMHWEDTLFVLWTRRSVLTRDGRKQDDREQVRKLKGSPRMRESQMLWLADGPLVPIHESYVRGVAAALERMGVGVSVLRPETALRALREDGFPETGGAEWRPCRPGSGHMPAVPEAAVLEETWGADPDVSELLWPPLREQLFPDDALHRGIRHVRIGGYDWAGVDMTKGPEAPSPFPILFANLRRTRTPFRVSFLIEGGREVRLRIKGLAATLLAWASPANGRIRDAVNALTQMRADGKDIPVLLRASLATWAPAGQDSLLRQRVATLAAGVQGWGVCQTDQLAGDALAGVMSSAPGMAIASTAPYLYGPLHDVLTMLPWNRPGSPWERGSLTFRTFEGRPFPVDAVGSLRQMVFDIISGEPGHGKSVLCNTINLALILSHAAQTSDGAELPLVGVLDIAPSAKGLIDLLRAVLPRAMQHLALYVRYEKDLRFSVNVLDTQLAFRAPLPLEMTFLQNLLSLACTPIGTDEPFEGMDGLVSLVLSEVYRLASDKEHTSRPKVYNPTLMPEVAAGGGRRPRPGGAGHPPWWDVVDALIAVGEHRLAGLAQRHAVPVLADLIEAARSPVVVDQYGRVRASTGEPLIEVFQRYVTGLIEWLPQLSQPTAWDTGEARVIVLDLEDVAPSGGLRDDRQTELMYMVGRHILARNFFLRPGYARYAPENVRDYHRRRFTKIKDTVKRITYDEFHRTGGARRIQEQVQVDRREGRKHRVHLGLSSQMLRDFTPALAEQATGVWVLGAGNEDANRAVVERFGLSPAAADIVRHRLKGPGRDGQGAPFLAQFSTSVGRVEHALYNSLGPVEIWALSTRPVDVALRDRLYEAVGASEAWRRLARVFPHGTAEAEIDRRSAELTRRGLDEGRAQESVIGGILQELVEGTGIGLVLRQGEAGGTRKAA